MITISTFIDRLAVAGCFVVALFALVLAYRVLRTKTLADKERRAEYMRREELRARMQPRYTPPQKVAPRFMRGDWRDSM